MSASEQPKNDADRESNEDRGGRRLQQPADGAHEVPLFLRGGREGRKGNAQDEKDEVGE